MDQPGGLVADHPQDAGVSVAQGVDADAGNEVEVAALIDVVGPAALAARQHERIAGVVL